MDYVKNLRWNYVHDVKIKKHKAAYKSELNFGAQRGVGISAVLSMFLFLMIVWLDIL